MKKFELPEIEAALNQIEGLTGPVIDYLRSNLQKQQEEKMHGPFKKASDAYLSKLTFDDVIFRDMEPGDRYYLQGFKGVWEKSTGRLLRRHCDTLSHVYDKLRKNSSQQ